VLEFLEQSLLWRKSAAAMQREFVNFIACGLKNCSRV
jgi:hypothetical protein